MDGVESFLNVYLLSSLKKLFKKLFQGFRIMFIFIYYSVVVCFVVKFVSVIVRECLGLAQKV